MASNIILVGMPAAGKSTVGVILAKVLGMDFIDTDLIIQRDTGKRLSDLIAEEGHDGFIRTEEKICCGINAENSVISTGGSVIYGDAAMKHLKENGMVVYHEIDFETLEKRLHHMSKRGVVLKEGQTKKELYDERVELYKKYADIIIHESGMDIEDTVSLIIEEIASEGFL